MQDKQEQCAKGSRARRVAHFVRLIVIALAVCGVDRWTKSWATSRLAPGNSLVPLKFIDFRYWENTGIVFGTFEGSGVYLAPLSILASAFLLYCYYDLSHEDRLSAWGIALVLGGAVGNLIDRISLGYVVDFIYVKIWPFPFNVADCCVSVGLVLFLAGSFLVRRDKNASDSV